MNGYLDRRRRGVLLGAALAVTALAATGCHVTQSDEPVPPSSAANALDELRALPSLEESKEQMQEAIDDIKTAADGILPSITWEKLDEGASGNCEKPYEQTGGKRYFLPNAVGVGAAVSESDWAQILEAATRAAAQVDATDVQVMQDDPGNRDVGFYGPAGAFVKVSYAGNLVVSGYTGCRLPEEQK